MADGINWSLLQPVDTGAAVQQGFATGMALVKHVQTQNALRAYTQNPGDPQAFSALMAYDPQTAVSLQEANDKRHKLLQDQETLRQSKLIGAQAAGGDTAGARTAALSAGQFDLAEQIGKLDDAHVKRIHDGWEAAGSMAYTMLHELKTPEQRSAYWQQNRPILESQGVPSEVLDKIDPNNIAQLNGVLNQSLAVKDRIANDRPQLIATQPGGGVIGYTQSGGLQTLVAPNPGGAPTGAPVNGGGTGGGSGISGKNNPGALRKPGSMEFETFGSQAEGIAKQESLLGRYIGGGTNTIGAIVEKYAPRQSRGGDNTDAQVNNYRAYVAKRLGLSENAPVTPEQVPQLAAAMREFETGHRAKAVMAHAGVDKAEAQRQAIEAVARGADPHAVAARLKQLGVGQ